MSQDNVLFKKHPVQALCAQVEAQYSFQVGFVCRDLFKELQRFEYSFQNFIVRSTQFKITETCRHFIDTPTVKRFSFFQNHYMGTDFFYFVQQVAGKNDRCATSRNLLNDFSDLDNSLRI